MQVCDRPAAGCAPRRLTMGEVVEGQETVEGWEFNEVLGTWVWVTFRKEGDMAADVFGWRWFEDRESFTEDWVEVLRSGFFRGLRD